MEKLITLLREKPRAFGRLEFSLAALFTVGYMWHMIARYFHEAIEGPLAAVVQSLLYLYPQPWWAFWLLVMSGAICAAPLAYARMRVEGSALNYIPNALSAVLVSCIGAAAGLTLLGTLASDPLISDMIISDDLSMSVMGILTLALLIMLLRHVVVTEIERRSHRMNKSMA